MKLPWNGKPSRKKMLKDEMWELIDVLRTHDPNSPEYRRAFEAYAKLHSMEIEEKKLREHRFGRIADILGTIGLAGIVLTHEYWTPITSSWGRSLTKPFSHNDSNLLM